MRVLAVGGHTRNIGKTSLVVDLIRAFPEAGWTAAKITQHGHGVCSLNGAPCGCEPREHPYALDEERDAASGTDTSRFLEAGAARALWVRARQGCLGDALPQFISELTSAGNVIVESNTLLDFVTPRLFLMVLDSAQADFKDSARRHWHRADAFILRSPLNGEDVGSRPCFHQPLGTHLPSELVAFIRQRFF